MGYAGHESRTRSPCIHTVCITRSLQLTQPPSLPHTSWTRPFVPSNHQLSTATDRARLLLRPPARQSLPLQPILARALRRSIIQSLSGSWDQNEKTALNKRGLNITKLRRCHTFPTANLQQHKRFYFTSVYNLVI